MRKISATYIFPGNRPPLKNGILTCQDDGTVMDVTDTGGRLAEQHGLEYYSGILVPGFVNTHCHLELSHMEGKIPEKTGLSGFLGYIGALRNSREEDMVRMIQKADLQMRASGIVAAGDISNGYLTLGTKKQSPIFYHTFVEAFGFHPSRAERAFLFAEYVEKMFKESGLSASVTPHAPYSVSEMLFKRIRDKAREDKSIQSVHSQESMDEALFFHDGTGPIAHHIQEILGIEISGWTPPRKGSLAYILSFLNPENPLLLVHNTFTSEADIRELKSQRKMENTFFVLCPNANLYIENRLPQVSLFREEGLNICLGTDSLASNHALSILNEMIILHQYFPSIAMQDLVDWACPNGARALGIEGRYGSFKPALKPGVNLITGVDLKNLRFTGKSRVQAFRFRT